MESGERRAGIIAAATRYRMFSPGDRVLVAVSGGPDSVAMLHALHTHSNELGVSLHVAHLNHSIRGNESDMDEAFVRELAAKFGLEITVERADVPKLRQDMRMGEEEAARVVRHQFLQQTAERGGAGKIAIGHTADDRAESVLLNVIRGSGVDGLGSIRPVTGNIVRPLIDTWRSEVEAYITDNALSFRTDESNADTSYSRNRVRHELIPLLEAQYNPQTKEALLRLARIAADQSDLLADLAVTAAQKVTYQGAIDAGLFLDLPPALQYQVVRAEIERFKGDLLDVSFEQVERVIGALGVGGDFTITLPSGRIYAERRGQSFRIRCAEEPVVIQEFDHPLQVPGRTVVDEIGLALEAEVIEGALIGKVAPNEVLIDADAVLGSIRVRSIRPGDRITPFGMNGEKKLQDVFVDKKIPKRERARAAVVVDDERILWVVGTVASEATRVTDKTRRVIRITSDT